jgi:NTP pyrophosphatase (non-canonical NTP hydrolase)
VKCNNELIDMNVPVPRTCAVHGLGPCPPQGVTAMHTYEDGTVTFTIPTLAALQKRAHQTSRDHGWWENHDAMDATVAGAKIALMHSELSEALEEIRKGPGHDKALAEELADTIIRILDFAGARGLDLQGELLAKMAKNDARPHRHGGKAL